MPKEKRTITKIACYGFFCFRLFNCQLINNKQQQQYKTALAKKRHQRKSYPQLARYSCCIINNRVYNRIHMKFIRKTYLIEDRMLEDIKTLQEHLRLTTEVNVIRTAINLLWKDTYKYGTDPRINPTTNDTEEQMINKARIKAKAKKLEKEAIEAEELRPKIEMCQDLLKGTITEDEQGYKYCNYTQYWSNGKNEECVFPIRQMDPIIAETSLFMPSKEAVFARRKDIKKLFNY